MREGFETAMTTVDGCRFSPEFEAEKERNKDGIGGDGAAKLLRLSWWNLDGNGVSVIMSSIFASCFSTLIKLKVIISLGFVNLGFVGEKKVRGRGN